MIIYVSSMSQSYVSLLIEATRIADRLKAEGRVARIHHLLSHLNQTEEKAAADAILQLHQENPDVTFIVPAFYETLLLRLLRRVRENELGTEALECHVLSANGVHVMEVDQEGEFKRPWPEGFMDGRMEEIF